jgi:hypothetical protein
MSIITILSGKDRQDVELPKRSVSSQCLTNLKSIVTSHASSNSHKQQLLSSSKPMAGQSSIDRINTNDERQYERTNVFANQHMLIEYFHKTERTNSMNTHENESTTNNIERDMISKIDASNVQPLTTSMRMPFKIDQQRQGQSNRILIFLDHVLYARFSTSIYSP